MSGREFFGARYRQLGWELRSVKPRTAIRVNTHNIDAEALIKRLHAQGVELVKVPWLDAGYWVTRTRVSVGATVEYLLGLYSVQEAAAQLPASLFTSLNRKLVLDACAAPGGKTVQLANLMKNTGVIFALDVATRRLAALANHLERCHVRNVIACLLDATRASTLGLKFDRILLDLPCSGNFAGDSGWFKRRRLSDVKRNAAVQRAILAEAVRCLNDNGEIVYSTCSLEPEEDELNVDWAVKNLPLEVAEVNCYGGEGLTQVFGVELDNSVKLCRRIWPDETQGFFICKFRRVHHR